MLEYSSNGVLSKPAALRDGCTVSREMFDANGGKIISTDYDELRSARQYIMQRNEKTRKNYEIMLYAGAAAAIISVIAIVIGTAALGFVGFILTAAIFGATLVAGAVLVLIALGNRKKLEQAGQCKITAYRFEIREKFYQVETYPRGGKVTTYYAVFGGNTVFVKKEQYDNIKVGNTLTCMIAEYPDHIYFALTGRL